MRKVHEFLERKLVEEHGDKDEAERPGITGAQAKRGRGSAVRLESPAEDPPTSLRTLRLEIRRIGHKWSRTLRLPSRAPREQIAVPRRMVVPSEWQRMTPTTVDEVTAQIGATTLSLLRQVPLQVHRTCRRMLDQRTRACRKRRRKKRRDEGRKQRRQVVSRELPKMRPTTANELRDETS